MMCEWMLKEIFLKKTPQQRKEFEPQTERMRRRLIPLLFTIFHFFEKYRELHLKHLAENDGVGLKKQPYTINPIETQIMDMYDDQTLLRVHQVFPLVISSFCRRLRPPSYIGRVEKSLRGYLKDKPADEVHVAILCLGGLRQVERFWEVKGYNTRRNAVDDWYNAVVKDQTPQVELEPKKRRGLMGLGRKKSMVALGKSSEQQPAPGHRGSYDNSAGHQPFNGFVFNTSLAAGMPMSMDEASRDRMRPIIPDLPVLQKIWLETAEAMILSRKIVEHSGDIKRNAAVMLELIREDGMELEDEWLYGTVAHESVPAELTEAIVEDDLMTNKSNSIRKIPASRCHRPLRLGPTVPGTVICRSRSRPPTPQTTLMNCYHHVYHVWDGVTKTRRKPKQAHPFLCHVWVVTKAFTRR